MCQRSKPRKHAIYGILSPLPIPRGPFVEITINFITDLPPSINGSNVCDSILIIVDYYTKLLKYLPTNKTINALGLINIIYRHVFLTFGWPKGIILDRKSVFISAIWMALYYYISVARRLSIAFHLQIDK